MIHDSDIIVAVIDSGVDYNHPDISDNMWINENEFYGDPNSDDDNNGYIDDLYGYDFCTMYGKQRDSDPMDDYLHGTHVAGIIGAVGNNVEGVTGVCWNIKIMAIKFLSYDGVGNTGDAIASIEYSVNMGAKILNNSWGGGYYNESLEDTIANASGEGVLFIASAGNDGYSSANYPALYDLDNIISVLSTDNHDNRSVHNNLGMLYSWESNYGEESVD